MITALDKNNDLQAVSSTITSGHPLSISRIRDENSNEPNPAEKVAPCINNAVNETIGLS